jgi:hypothetical protein
MWERLEWVIDIDRLVRSRAINWDMIDHAAKIMDIEPMIHLGCAVANDLFDTPLPKNIKQDEAIACAKKIIVNDLYEDKIFDEGRIMNTVYYLGLGKINSSWYEGAMKLLRYTKGDIYMVNLPNFLSFIYHFIHLYNTLTYRTRSFFSSL